MLGPPQRTTGERGFLVVHGFQQGEEESVRATWMV